MIKAGSPTESMSRMALAASMELVTLDAVVWFEHVPSKDNPADVLSREALKDTVVRAKLEGGEWLYRDAIEPQPADSFPLNFSWLSLEVEKQARHMIHRSSATQV